MCGDVRHFRSCAVASGAPVSLRAWQDLHCVCAGKQGGRLRVACCDYWAACRAARGPGSPRVSLVAVTLECRLSVSLATRLSFVTLHLAEIAMKALSV